MAARKFLAEPDTKEKKMTLQEAIELRRSRRKYLTTPIAPATIQSLEGLARECSVAANARIELVWNNDSAWNGISRSYGMFSGVSNYAGLIAKKGDLAAVERLGYYGELLLLHAVALGLGTCWVGGSFDRKRCPFLLAEDEMIYCAIAVGNTAEQNSKRENLIQRMTPRHSKSAEDMIRADAPVPQWVAAGMQAVCKAPSAVNRQPVLFTLKKGKVTAHIEKETDTGTVFDLGIAKLHFELGAGQGSWVFGNHGEFIR